MGEEDQRLYEASYFLNGTCSEEEAHKEDEKIKSMVAQNQALILGEIKPKRQRFAYPVKKSAEGYFGWVRFSTDPEHLTKIKNELDKNNLIVKMLVKIFKNPPPESKIVKFPARPQKTVNPETVKLEAIKTEEIDKKLEEILGS